MTAPNVLRRRKVKRILARRTRYQFGQKAGTNRLVTSRGGTPGDVGCADTMIQLTLLICTGKRFSQDQVRRMSGNAPHVPMFATNALNALNRGFGRPVYEIRDVGTKEALRIARERGPVLFAEMYWAHPHMKGAPRSTGRARNNRGRVVTIGFAKEGGNNNQEFVLGHMVGLMTSTKPRVGPERAFVRDPNHNSARRPQRPRWDLLLGTAQLSRMLDSIRPKWSGKRLAFVPKEVVVKV